MEVAKGSITSPCVEGKACPKQRHRLWKQGRGTQALWCARAGGFRATGLILEALPQLGSAVLTDSSSV